MYEDSITHILNAESKKLQAVINMPIVTADQLMAANKSTKNTMDTVVRLSLALKAKLETFRSVICQVS